MDDVLGAGVYSKLATLGLILLFIGVGLIILGLLLPLLSGGVKARGEGGAVIIIGPIPIVLASSPETAKILLILAIVLTVILVAFFFLLPGLLTRQGIPLHP